MNAATIELVEKAAAKVVDSVYAPVFLQKMAERGYPVHTDEDARELLDLGFKLASNGMTSSQSEAGQTRSKYASANDALDNLLNGNGAAEDYRFKAAAAQIVQDPAVFEAAFVLMEAEKAAAAELAAK